MIRKGLAVAWALLGTSLMLTGQERFRKIQPPPEPFQELRLPPIETSPLLENKLRVSVVTREKLPLMSLHLLFFDGESSSPVSAPGTATFAAHMLIRSTQLHSAPEIENMVDSIGGSLSVAVFEDFTIVAFYFLEDFLDQALDLLSQLLLQPNFTEKEIRSVKSLLSLDFLEMEKDPVFVANRHLIRMEFENHPYQNWGFPRDAVKNWNQKDLLDFFDRHYRPNNAHLILTGNTNLQNATRKVTHYLNTWRPRDFRATPFPPIPLPLKDKVCFIDVPLAKYCAISLGIQIPSALDLDPSALAIVSQVLGGTANSRLFMNLRESKAYANYAYSKIEFYKTGGLFSAWARVAPEHVYPSVQEILKEIRRIGKEPIAPSEIDQARSYLIGNFPIFIERYDDFSERISEITAFGWGSERWSKPYDLILLASPEKIFAAQKSLLQPSIIVIAGDKTTLMERLREFDSIDIYDSKGILQYTMGRERSPS